ncbi:MAG: Uma2 family endonuclease [Cyanobacteria bacterium P01_F01_bin.13]
MELTAQGKIIVMSPTGSEGGSRNAEASADIVFWNRKTGLGKVFDSSSGFQLPNGAIRSLDTAWLPRRVGTLLRQNSGGGLRRFVLTLFWSWHLSRIPLAFCKVRCVSILLMGPGWAG